MSAAPFLMTWAVIGVGMTIFALAVFAVSGRLYPEDKFTFGFLFAFFFSMSLIAATVKTIGAAA